MRTTILTLAALLGLALARPAHAQWFNDPYRGMVPVSLDSTSDQAVRVLHLPNGNTIAVWGWGVNYEFPFKVRYQVVGPLGVPLLPANGIPVIDGEWQYGWYAAHLMPDGFGGAIVVFGDSRNGMKDIYGQRFDSLGNRLWGPTGMPIAVWPDSQDISLSDVCCDSAGGFFVAWTVQQEWLNIDTYVQKFDANGRRIWGNYGAAACTAIGNQNGPEIVADGRGGVIDVWVDNRPAGFDYYLYGQHIDPSGHSLWTRQGVQLVAPHFGIMWSPGVKDGVPDGMGGGVWAFAQGIGSQELWRFRLVDPGRVVWLGITEISVSYDVEELLRHPGDGMVWLSVLEHRGIPDLWFYHLYRFNALTGEQLLGPSGIHLGAVNQYYGATFTSITPTSDGVIAFLAYDIREISHLTAWRVSNSGTIFWRSEVALGGPSALGGQAYDRPWSTSDGADGAICAWQDWRNYTVQNNNVNIYAQRVLRNGQLGNPPSAAQLQPSSPTAGLSESAGIIRYVLPQAGEVKLELFDLLGRRVALLEQRYRPAGEQMTRLNRQDYPSGIYWLRLTTAGQQQLLKVVIVR
jgi:hypothetical protein